MDDLGRPLDARKLRKMLREAGIEISERNVALMLHDAGVLFGPGKAANAGGVAVSGLEMSQNSIRMAWAAEELERRLRDIMNGIHDQCVHYGQDNGQNGDQVNYVRGANVAGFRKVADAMLAYGAI